jgi:hypothetical protein
MPIRRGPSRIELERMIKQVRKTRNLGDEIWEGGSPYFWAEIGDNPVCPQLLQSFSSQFPPSYMWIALGTQPE